MTDSGPRQADAATRQTAPKPRARRVARPKAAPAARVLLRYTGDGSEFISNVPMRDVTTDDGLSEELINEAADHKHYERV